MYYLCINYVLFIIRYQICLQNFFLKNQDNKLTEYNFLCSCRNDMFTFGNIDNIV